MVGLTGVSVEVKYGNTLLQIGKDGSLGKFDDRLSFRLEVTVSPEAGKVLAFTVDGGKNINLKRVAESGDNQIYRLKISVVKGDAGVCFTPYPNNHLRLLKLESNGQFQIWELAIISQREGFFLTIQTSMEAACYQEQSKVMLPSVKWPQLLTLLNGHLQPADLPSISQFQKPAPAVSTNLKQGTGRVLWFNAAMGFGALMTPQGPARVHWTQISRGGNGSARCFLETGELVSFQKLERPIQNGDGRKTTFSLEARGVRLAA